MAVAWSATGSSSETAPAWPTHVAGDFGLLVVQYESGTLSAPAGWTRAPGAPYMRGTAPSLDVFYKFAASGAEGAPSITGPTDHVFGVIITYTGVNTLNPFHLIGIGDNPSTATQWFVGLTTFLDGCMIVNLLAWAIDSAGPLSSGEVNADLGSLTERFDGGTLSGNGGGLVIVDGTKASKGSFTFTEITLSSSSVTTVATLALQASDQAFGQKSRIVNNRRSSMPILCKQSTAQNFSFFMADSADGKTGKTGLTLAVTLKKGGESTLSSISPTVTEIGNGQYDAALTTTHMNTLGNTSLRATATGADPADCPNCIDVVSIDKQSATRGFTGTSLPDAAAEAAGGLYTRGSGAGQINQNANGQADSRTVAMANDVVTAAAIADNAIDAGAIAADAITAAKIADNAIDAGAIATGAITSAKFAAGAIDAAAIADNAIDAGAIAADALTAAKIAAGAIDRATFAQDALDVLGEVRRFTAAGGSTTTVTFDAGANGTDNDFYKNAGLLCVGGTGAGQIASVASYVAATKVATLDRTAAVAFDNTSVFELRHSGGGGSLSGTVDANVTQWVGTSVATPNTAGVPRVDVKFMEASVLTATAIATGAVTAAKFAADAITSTVIADSAITANKLATGAITAAKFAADAITSTVLATSAAQKVRDSLLDYAYRTGRTVRGLFRRWGAALEIVTGLNGSTVTYKQPDGSTTEFTVTQDPTNGNRSASNVTNSETP